MNNDQIVAHYKELFNRHGISSNAVQWDKGAHLARFNLLVDIDSELNSVLDVGAGLGHFYGYLRNQGFQGKYLGLEIVEEFVESAKSLMLEDKNADIRQFNVVTEDFPTGFDYGFISGVFNNNRENAKEFMYTTLSKLWRVCEKGMSLNVLSTYVEYFDDDLYYVNPLSLFEFLKLELRGHVVMHHDYVFFKDGYPYEVTYFVRKNPRNISL